MPSVFIKLCLYINYFISFAGIPEKDIITNQHSRHFWNTSLVEQYLVFSHSWEATELLLIINRLEKIPLCVTASHFSPCQHFHLTFFPMRIISGREETAFNANIHRHSQMPPTPLLMTITNTAVDDNYMKAFKPLPCYFQNVQKLPDLIRVFRDFSVYSPKPLGCMQGWCDQEVPVHLKMAWHGQF